ncbi:MAG: OmpA family protein [Saprospiraceae bacterium]|nr:OmpA family protein [Saprospiraceae bacterium]
MKVQSLFFPALAAVFLLFSTGCKKKEIQSLKGEISLKDQQIQQLEQNLGHLQATNNSLLDRMSDLSIVSKTEAESIKKSLENISDQYGFIQDLTQKIQQKDSLNLALVMNLKRSLSNINDDDIQIEVRGGKVHVSISDKLLFDSGSSRLNTRAMEVLDKIATVVNDHDGLDIIVEGHTDNVPISNSCLKDNWDLSAHRATAVVRVLQDQYYVAPDRLMAAGRSQYLPIADNSSPAGQAANRRTEIVITPNLDQFFQLLESPALSD